VLAAEEAKLVAGGMTLIPTLKQRLAKPSDLVDLGAISSLVGITDDGDGVVIGAMTRHADVNRSPIVKAGIPALAAMAGMIGDPAVRNRGTIGGSIANNDPAADYPGSVLALNATIRTTSARSPATISSQGCLRQRSNPLKLLLQYASRKWRSELPEIPQPGLALRHRRRIRRPHCLGGAGRGHRRRTMRVPHPGDGGCARRFVHAGRDQGHRDPG